HDERPDVVEHVDPEFREAVERKVHEQEQRDVANELDVGYHEQAEPGRPEAPAERSGHPDDAADQERERGELQAEGQAPGEPREALPRQKPIEMVGAHRCARAYSAAAPGSGSERPPLSDPVSAY